MPGRAGRQRPLPLPLREAEDVGRRRHQDPLPGLRGPRGGAGEEGGIWVHSPIWEVFLQGGSSCFPPIPAASRLCGTSSWETPALAARPPVPPPGVWCAGGGADTVLHLPPPPRRWTCTPAPSPSSSSCTPSSRPKSPAWGCWHRRPWPPPQTSRGQRRGPPLAPPAPPVPCRGRDSLPREPPGMW